MCLLVATFSSRNQTMASHLIDTDCFTSDENTINRARKEDCHATTLGPLIRESQSLQLCALHSMNNLLQLRPVCKKIGGSISSPGSDDENLILCGGDLYCHSKLKAGSKAEFNAIADELTFQETQLYSQNEPDGESNHAGNEEIPANRNHGRHLSYWQLLRSHHRTPITGNYSFEVSYPPLISQELLIFELSICITGARGSLIEEECKIGMVHAS